MNINKIVVLGGGFSEEKDVSRVSAEKIVEAFSQCISHVTLLDPANFASWSDLIEQIKVVNPDICFIGLHGGEGEDGRIQSLLELHGIPFTGSDFKSCCLAMDKEVSGILAQSAGSLVPDRIILEGVPGQTAEILKTLGLPLVVKPNNSGSSMGISIVRNEEDCQSALLEAFKYSKRVICERFVDGRELTVTILDNKPLPVVEIKPNNGWYDYANKYTKGNTIYQVPAQITEVDTISVQKQALSIFRLMGCEGYGRVDFRFDGDDFYFLEVNTLPGMTPLSLTPMAAGKAGYSFSQLLMKIVEIALSRKK